MSHEISKTIEKVSKRLSDATATGQTLAGVVYKENFIGDIGNESLPMVTLRLSPNSQTENLKSVAINGLQTMLIEAEITGYSNVEDGWNDSQYSKGLMVLLEKVLKTIKGSNVTGDNAWSQVPVYNVQGYGQTANALYFVIRIQLESKMFQAESLI